MKFLKTMQAICLTASDRSSSAISFAKVAKNFLYRTKQVRARNSKLTGSVSLHLLISDSPSFLRLGSIINSG